MVRSVRVVSPVATIAAAGVLAGCSTTMQEASRLQLNSARIRASQVVTRVSAQSRQVRLVHLGLLTVGNQTAFIATVRNGAKRAVSDLPISVGYRVAGRAPVYLNATNDLGYFQTHLPAVEPGGTLTWVLTAGRALPAGAHAFGLIGASPTADAHPTERLPRITARTTALASRLKVALHNLSGVPQYQLQVYAVARRAGGYVGAGATTVAHLGTGSTQTIELPVLGSLSRATVQVEALPTIFH